MTAEREGVFVTHTTVSKQSASYLEVRFKPSWSPLVCSNFGNATRVNE